LLRFRNQLLQIQIKNYQHILKLIDNSLGPVKRWFSRYANEYKKELLDYTAISNPSELFSRVGSSDVVYHGDYHTLKQSQKSVLRVLREISKKRNIILCMETFYGNDQKYLDQYLDKKISEKDFLKAIDYYKKWGYKFQHWKKIIKFCQKQKIPILGINSEQNNTKNPVKERDIFSAKIIGKAIIRYPENLIYVVDGDYHISPTHLPLEVEKKLDQFDIKVKRTIIYQNSESLYWKLAGEGKEDEDVIKISNESFCVMNAIPTNKLQSYLNWLEYSEDAYFPEAFKWDERQNPDKLYSIHNIVKTITSIMQISYPEEAISNLSIYYPDNLNFINILAENNTLKKMIPSVKRKIKNNEGFLLEYNEKEIGRYIIYLTNSNLSMAAEEATHFINVACRGRFTDKISLFDNFYRNLLTECLGFYGSKLIVPKRKVDTLSNLRRFLGTFKNQKVHGKLEQKLNIAHLILKHHYLEKKVAGKKEFEKKFFDLYMDKSGLNKIVSTQLGYILGQKLFKVVKKGKFPLNEVKELFYNSLNKPNQAFQIYLMLSLKLDKLKHHK